MYNIIGDNMLDNLTQGFSQLIHNIKGYGYISEDNVSGIIRQLRLVLLEADVDYQVIKDFLANIKEKALGTSVLKSLKPSDVFIKLVHDELETLLGTYEPLSNTNPLIIMMVGLQGSGKTTTSGKLALFLRKKQAKNPLLVACDIYRPAAILQLQQIGKQLAVDVFTLDDKPEVIAAKSLIYAKEHHHDVIILDTAGRLHIDELLMQELVNINNVAKPNEILLVLDSMIGQDAINVISAFNESLKITGCVLSKMDSNTKGGVALSIRKLTNVPIKFMGVSEKMDGLELFDPARVANRILGSGDLLSIVDKVSDVFGEEDLKQSEVLSKQDFTLTTFLETLKQLKKLGPLENIIKMLPGTSKIGNVNVNPKDLLHMEAIILSMTKEERSNPDILKASRKLRIAKGSGVEVSDINRLLKQYDQMKMMMKQYKKGNLKLPKF